jgi:hypothetical protein
MVTVYPAAMLAGASEIPFANASAMDAVIVGAAGEQLAALEMQAPKVAGAVALVPDEIT